MSVYKHSQKFLEKKLKKIKKQINKLEKQKEKLTAMYLNTFPKEVIEIIKEQEEQEKE